MEAVLFFYRGVWPSKLKATQRTMVVGSTGDDVWIDVPEANMEGVPKLPYIVKKTILEETAWAAVSVGQATTEAAAGEQEVEKSESDSDVGRGQKRNANDDKGKRDKDKSKKDKKEAEKDKKDDKKDEKDKKGNKGKPKAKGKTKATPKAKQEGKKGKLKKSRNSNKMVVATRAPLPLPSYGHDEATLQDTEFFCHNDVSLTAWRQAFREWDARAAVVWSLGNGTGLLGAVLDELPVLGFAVDNLHLTFVAFAVDVEIARRFQVPMEDNKLFDSDLKKKIQKAADGEESGNDSDAPAKRDRKKTDKKDKKEKQNKKDQEEDDEEEDDDNSDSESSDSSDS